MARNELTKNAMRIESLIFNVNQDFTDREISKKLGVDTSTLCRFKQNHLSMFCAYLDAIGLSVFSVEEDKPIPKDKLASLVSLAENGLEQIKEEYLDK